MTQFENIVVVGGGYAGVRLAQTFEKKFSSGNCNNKFRIILVDKVNIRDQKKSQLTSIVVCFF